MTQLALAKMITDCLLVAAVLYLALRNIKGTSQNSISGIVAREMRDLQISLKTLLRDADIASQSLNESLARRQRNLEDLLQEISAAESRVIATVDSASRAGASARTTRSEVTRTISEPVREPSMARPPTVIRSSPRQEASRNESATQPVMQRAASMNVFGEEIASSTPEIALSPAIESHIETEISPVMPAMESDSTTRAPIYRQQRLAKQIEIERAVRSVAEAQHLVNQLESESDQDEFFKDEPPIVSSAPSSKDHNESSSAHLNIELESPESSTKIVTQSARDSRLGVLGTVRRHTQVL